MISTRLLSWGKLSETAFQAKTFIVLILAIAAYLRLKHLDDHSLWLDEIFSLQFARLNLSQIISEIIAWENHPPLYYFVLHYTTELLGKSEFALRLPSALFSVLSVFFTYKVGRLLFNSNVGLIAAFLMAISPFSVRFAQETRMYSLLEFTSLLSVYFFLRWFKEQTTRLLVIYMLSTIFLVYTHIYGLFVLVAENIYVATILLLSRRKTDRPKLKTWAVSQALIIAISSPWLALLITKSIQLQETDFWIPEPTLRSFKGVFATYAGNSEGHALFALLMLMGLLSFLKRGKGVSVDDIDAKHANGIFVASLLLVIVNVVPFLISQFSTPMYVAKYTIAGYFGFLLLVAAGTERIGHKWRFLALALLTVSLLSSFYGQKKLFMNRAQYREAVAFLAKKISEEDVILLCGDKHLSLPFKHYAARQGIANELIEAANGIMESDEPTSNRVWFVRMGGRMEGCENETSVLKRGYDRIRSVDNFRHLELLLLEKKP